jgi:hypothetical protein
VEQVSCSQVIFWNLEDDVEVRSFEVEKIHRIVKSKEGEFLILTHDYTIFPEQNCLLKCYTMHEDWEDIVKEPLIPYSQGYRFDTHSHNWICMKQYVNFSFSYMTFVIQEKITEDMKDNIDSELFHDGFDVEAFNYIIDMDNCFINGSLAAQSFLML